MANQYTRQRPKVEPPIVTLADLRVACGFTLDQVCARAAEAGRKLERGSLSAIENGHRGASEEAIRALEAAYGLREGSIQTTYAPKRGRAAA